MIRLCLFALALLLAACGDNGGSPTPPAQAPGWEIGPTIDGKNYSIGAVAGNIITFGDLHYVTHTGDGPLSGTMRIAFHLSAPVKGTGCTGPATATLYFQRQGDDWNTDGARWWATFATVTLDHAGDYSMVAPLDGPWTSVEHKTAANAPADFADAKAHAGHVGFTLGNCTGYGHGASGPAVLTITDFQ